MSKKLLTFKAIINYQEMADLLLVWSGFKKAAMIELSYFGKSKKYFIKRVHKFENILNELGLVCELNLNYPGSRNEVTKFSYVARNKKTLKALISADKKRDIEDRRMALGKILGYPMTAVKAFAKNESINLKKMSKEAFKSKHFNFLNFRLSNNWRREFEYVNKRAEEIHKISPQLYRKIIARR